MINLSESNCAILKLMIKTDETSLILLTYKGKILLMLRELDPYVFNDPYLIKKHSWNFIGGVKKSGESFQDAIIKRVEGITGIKLLQIKFLSFILNGNKKRCLYHAQLSDQQVNRMERGEGHLLQFFSFKELENLPLADSTRLFIAKHKDLMEGMFQKPLATQ